MNSNHTGQSQPGSTFSSQPASQTNPFTADLKGEFTSNFGTNTNAVSQIFKDGGFVSNNNTKWIIIGLVVAALGVGAYFLLTSDSDTGIDIGGEDEAKEEATAEEGKTEEGKEEAAAGETTDAAQTAETAPTEQAQTGAESEASTATSSSISLVSPGNGDARAYDETSGPAVFQWEGGGRMIKFSRSARMRPVYMKIPVSGSSYEFYNPYPGTWYWQVDNSEIRKFTVDSPVKRSLSLTEPAAGAAIAGSGGVVAWKGDAKVAFYRVEFSNDGNWANPAFRFATSGERVQTEGMAPGQYQMRLGAFSEVSGRWEYTEPSAVTIQ